MINSEKSETEMKSLGKTFNSMVKRIKQSHLLQLQINFDYN